MRILAIETSEKTLSVGVVEDTAILGEYTTHINRTHGERLAPAIDTLMEGLELAYSDLDRIAVSKGPGSYTGLRIGVTTAKTLAWSLDIELVGISSLQVLAANTKEKGKVIVPISDARRENVYTGQYAYDKNDKLQTLVEDRHIAIEEWVTELEKVEEPIVFVGEDALAFDSYFQKVLEDYSYAHSLDNIPRAVELAYMAQGESPEDVHTFTPEYLKLAEAEENWRKENPDHGDDDFVETI
jgi:tRNA threonylcarbamoyladenosine biosynthesis protein TsaB